MSLRRLLALWRRYPTALCGSWGHRASLARGGLHRHPCSCSEPWSPGSHHARCPAWAPRLEEDGSTTRDAPTTREAPPMRGAPPLRDAPPASGSGPPPGTNGVPPNAVSDAPQNLRGRPTACDGAGVLLAGPPAPRPLAPGDRVWLGGLRTRVDLNGVPGRLLAFVPGKGRWSVRVDDDGEHVLVAPANLERRCSDPREDYDQGSDWECDDDLADWDSDW